MIGAIWILAAVMILIGVVMMGWSLADAVPAKRTPLGVTVGPGLGKRLAGVAPLLFLSSLPILMGIAFCLLAVAEGGPTFELTKADWRCTASHGENGAMVQAGAGGTTMILPTDEQVCDRYERVGTRS